MSQEFSSIADTVEAIARGEVVIIIDDEDRENEGDFVAAAELATPEKVNFVIRGGGEFCMPVLPEVCKRLELSPIVDANTTPLGTAHVTPIDHRSVKTGITAAERAKTVREIVNPGSTAADFVRPGHVHVLLAKEGGVLRRAGHTEAAVDLARMAGLAPAGYICEILDERGNRPSRDYLFELAQRHQLQITSIEKLIAHRRLSEKLVTRAAESPLPSKYGQFNIVLYNVKYEDQEPVALVHGDLSQAPQAPLVRMHSSCFTGDLIRSLRCDCGDQLHMALDMIRREGFGVLVYLPQEGRGIGLKEKIRAYALQDQGMDTVEANQALGYKADMRDYGVGIQVLKDLGLTNIRLLTNNPKKTQAASLLGYDLHVVDQVPIVAPINEHNAKYQAAKRDKMGHQLPPDE